jgi:branched-chain amino acid transport system permease protein
LRACREDEIAAHAAGINVFVQRLIAFVLSAFLLGVSGALYGSLLGTISVDTFFLDMTFMLVAMLVVGGVQSVAGAVVGVTAVSAVVEIFRRLQNGIEVGSLHLAVPAGLQGIALALFMLIVLIFRREGLTGGHEATLPERLRRMLPEVNRLR